MTVDNKVYLRCENTHPWESIGVTEEEISKFNYGKCELADNEYRSITCASLIICGTGDMQISRCILHQRAGNKVYFCPKCMKFQIYNHKADKCHECGRKF